MSEQQERWVFAVLGVVVVLAAWEGVIRAGLIDPVLLSRPSLIAEDAGDAFGSGSMAKDTLVTLGEWVSGFVLATVVGVPVGFVAARSTRFGPLAEHWCILLLIVPMVALVPLFILWLGIGIEMKILIAFLTALPPVALNTLEGVRSTDKDLVSVGRAFGANPTAMVRKVYLPSSMAASLAGVRIGAGQALVGVVFAEMVASSAGLGFAIRSAGSTFNTSRLMLGIAVLAAIAMIVGKSLEVAERKLDAWRE